MNYISEQRRVINIPFNSVISAIIKIMAPETVETAAILANKCLEGPINALIAVRKSTRYISLYQCIS